MVLKQSKDHWAFLDEIEAPMWADLTQEDVKNNSQDIGDEWFHTSHMFHLCSSHQLKAAFSCSGEGSIDSDFVLLGPSSPKLPPSVSRSRGKEYNSKKWGGETCVVSLNKPHPVKVLREKSKAVDIGIIRKMKSKSTFGKPRSTRTDISCEEIKSKWSVINSKGASSSERCLVSEESSTQDAKGTTVRPISSNTSSKSNTSSAVDKTNESNALSTVTYESSLRGHQNTIDVSSRALGHSDMLLSAVRITLRKSCVTRQASRVGTTNDKRQSMVESDNRRRDSRMEINSDRRESRDRKSYSSKSSVGSSSAPNDVNNLSLVMAGKKEKTPESRNVARTAVALSNQVKSSNVSKSSIIQKNKEGFNSRRENMTTMTKSNCREPGKAHVQSCTFGTKSLQPCRVNKQNSVVSSTKPIGKEGCSGRNRLVAAGKENAVQKMSNRLKCSSGENAAGGHVRDQIRKQQNVPHRGVTKVSAGQQEKISDRRDGTNLVCENKRIHLR